MSSPTDSRRARRRAPPRREAGQALVEFAIVTPLVVMILLFAIWFSELVTIKLKVQEATRYAAWEATAYDLHDYDQGRTANTTKYLSMAGNVMKDTALRYANLDSTDTSLLSVINNRMFSASWTPPAAVLINMPEEVVPGGTLVNLIVNVALQVVDLISALSYKNGNYVAAALVGMSDLSTAGARNSRMTGDSSWGFNGSGQIYATVFTVVTNGWASAGVGKYFMLNSPYVYIRESQVLLADSWRLTDGGDVYGNTTRPGVKKDSAYWKQVNRMFFINRGARSTAETFITTFRGLMQLALALTGSMSTPPNLSTTNEDFMTPTLVSKNYKNSGLNDGKVMIRQDRPVPGYKYYDTSPACSGSGCPSGSGLKAYGDTLSERGKYFMGCKAEMLLGCPSATLQQGNPFGDYLIRD